MYLLAKHCCCIVPTSAKIAFRQEFATEVRIHSQEQQRKFNCNKNGSNRMHLVYRGCIFVRERTEDSIFYGHAIRRGENGGSRFSTVFALLPRNSLTREKAVECSDTVSFSFLFT